LNNKIYYTERLFYVVNQRIQHYNPSSSVDYLQKFTSRKINVSHLSLPDSIRDCIAHYQELAITGVRSQAVAHKIELHLQRFLLFFE